MARISIKSGSTASPGPATEAPKLLETFDTAAGTAVGDLLKLTSSDYVEKITSNDPSEIPAGIFGVAYSKPTTTTVKVIFVGIIGGYSGFTVGGAVFINTDGTPTQTVPATGIVQEIGKAATATDLFVNLKQAMEQI